MIEAMVALSVAVVGILGVFTLTSRSLSINRVDADRYVAVNLANEGIELVKNLLDKNIMDDLQPWNFLSGYSGNGDYEMDYNDPGLTRLFGDARNLFFSKDGSGYYRYQQPEYPNDVQTAFKRVIRIESPTANHIKVVSKLSWTSRGGSYDFSVEDHFYDLKIFKYNLNQELGG